MLVATTVLGLVLASAALVRLMIRHGTIDIPGQRSSHRRPTPKGGGVGIAVATLLGVAGAGASGWCPAARSLAGVLVAGALIAAVAHADDRHQFVFGWKLAAQIGAALVLVATGTVATGLGPIDLGALGPVGTVVAVLVLTNAINFIDGLNGLAAGCALLAAVAASWSAAIADDRFVLALTVPLAAGLLGFLPFNYPRARIFMGDVGSQFIGVALAASTVRATPLLPGRWGDILIPLVLLPVLFDVGFTLLRRIGAGDRVTDAHRSHLYQLAHRAGVPAPAVTLVFWALSAIGAAVVPWRSAWPAVASFATAATLITAAATLVVARRSPIGRW